MDEEYDFSRLLLRTRCLRARSAPFVCLLDARGGPLSDYSVVKDCVGRVDFRTCTRISPPDEHVHERRDRLTDVKHHDSVCPRAPNHPGRVMVKLSVHPREGDLDLPTFQRAVCARIHNFYADFICVARRPCRQVRDEHRRNQRYQNRLLRDFAANTRFGFR